MCPVSGEDRRWAKYFTKGENADVEKDSFETIKEKWGERIQTSHFTEKTNVTSVIRKATRE